MSDESERSGKDLQQTRAAEQSLDARVRASQRRRRLVDAALIQGEPKSWDFQPFADASKSYVRNTIPLDDLEARARFPRV